MNSTPDKPGAHALLPENVMQTTLVATPDVEWPRTG